MYLVHSAGNPAIASGRLNLDQVYSACLERILDGQPLAKVVTFYLQFLEQHTTSFRFAVMQVVPQTGSLSLLAAPSLPEHFIRAIHEMKLCEKEGACGPAAVTGQPFFIDNIAAHPNWKDFSPEMAEVGITSCWSFPQIRENKCIGTLAVTGGQKQTPDPHTIAHYQAVAVNLSKIFSYCDYQQGKNSANWILQKQVSQQQEENKHLKETAEKLALKMAEAEHILASCPLPKTFRPMASGLIKETEALLAVVKTTFSFQKVITAQNKRNVSLKQLSRKELNQFYNALNRSTGAGSDMLGEAVRRLDELSGYISLITHNPVKQISLAKATGTMLSVIASTAKHIDIKACIDVDPDCTSTIAAGTFTQILNELILNVCHHSYPNRNEGKIWLSASKTSNGTYPMIRYIVEDEGQAIPRTTIHNAMRPAAATLLRRHSAPGGLGLCYQQITAGLGGTMQIVQRQSGGNKIIFTFPEQTTG